MTTAGKYLLRRPLRAVEAEPDRMTEQDALKILVSDTGGAACPLHEVGPVANHISGPLAAVPPEGHPDRSMLATNGSQRSSSAVDRLITQACGVPGSRTVDFECRCDGTSTHPLRLTMRQFSHGQVTRAQQNTTETQVRIEQAFHSGDVDRLIWSAEPRLDALKMLTDRARAEHGGDLPDLTVEAVVVLAQTLVGPFRWDVRQGIETQEWPVTWRVGVSFQTADSIMRVDFIHDRILQRLVEGN